MPAPKDVITVIREWLAKADNDLKTAAHTLTLGEDCPTDTVCFHTQQLVLTRSVRIRTSDSAVHSFLAEAVSKALAAYSPHRLRLPIHARRQNRPSRRGRRPIHRIAHTSRAPAASIRSATAVPRSCRAPHMWSATH